MNTEPGAKTVFDTIRISIEMFEEEGLRQINEKNVWFINFKLFV